MTVKKRTDTSDNDTGKDPSSAEATHEDRAANNSTEEAIATQIKNAHAAGTGALGRNDEKQTGNHEGRTSGADEY